MIWKHIAGAIRREVSTDTFQRWFKAIQMTGADEVQLTLRVPNNIYQLWIETNYMPLLQSAILEVLGSPRSIHFTICETPETAETLEPTDTAEGEPEEIGGENRVAAETDSEEETGEEPPRIAARAASRVPAEASGVLFDESALPTAEPRRRPRPSAAAAPPAPNLTTGMNPRNTFESFVVGANNQFAHAAAHAVAKSPAKTYNPLFVYGGVGLGKTHLMHAIGQYVALNKKGTKVLYISSEKFTNDFIDAIQNGKLVRFRNRYRMADVLLIDDIQFLAGKERSQEEFFHTFNALFDGHKQIILSSDRPPSEIQNLEARLVSRFEWGLTAELQPPDIETRVAILRKKAQLLHTKLDQSILEFLAQRIRTNVRRLEGALMRVATFASLSNGEITFEAIEHLLKDILQEEARRTVTIEQIQRKVAEHYDIRLADMTSKRRPANIAFPRQVAMYLSRELTKSSLSEIGDTFGGRDHGTVLHAHRLIKEKMRSDEKMRQTVHFLDSQLNR
ncbi:MAG TPA: chromosomal replication initiator protein DnaA [Chthoniobacteraceae bacterium]|nr:chromosomal replication initiator protein DnaA [Chthoniobacteraceae bacterium]